MSNDDMLSGEQGLAVAIIGMAARFPGAPDVDTFWRNLRGGVESIRFFSDEELKAMGVEPAALASPHFVKAAPVLERVGRFDAPFFGYSPREAEMMDPQHRLFLECAWKALEHAGHHPTRHPGATGIFAGSSLSTYLLFNLATHPELAGAEDTFPVMVGNDKDFLATRVAYHLDCKGPALTVQTGCSTSLVATHLACQALLGFQCDVALAGGVSVHMPQRTGYYHQEGGITSPDGHCRAFDAKGQGTLFGSGVGVVVLKRLEDALADGDTIHAVIRGSAINNDGSTKVGYTAP
ncbi:MAG TPA: polyketide synthase, partial [Archangium sp.]